MEKKQKRAIERPMMLSKFQKRSVSQQVTGDRAVSANTKILRRKCSWSI